MAEIPTFTPQGPRTTNFANLASGVGDFSGFFAQADAMRTTANLFAEQAQLIGALEDERVQEEAFTAGLVQGMDQSFDPNDIPTGITIADKAFREGAVQSYVANQEVAIETRLAELQVEHGDDPIVFREMAQQHIEGTVSQMPAMVGGPLALSMTRKANSSYIQLAKSQVAQSRAFHEQSMQDAIDHAILRLKETPAGSPEEAELQTRLFRLYDQAREAKMTFATEDRQAIRMMGIAEERLADQLTEMAIGGGVNTAIAIAQGTTGNPDIDNIDPDTRIRSINGAVQVWNLQQNIEAKNRSDNDRFIREQRADITASIYQNPDDPQTQERISYLFSSAKTSQEAAWAKKMSDYVEASPLERNRFLVSDPLILANIKLQSSLGKLSDEQLLLAVGNGVSIDDFLDLRAQREEDKGTVLESETMRLVDDILTEQFPDQKADPISVLMNLATEEEQQIHAGNRLTKLSILNGLREQVASGDITTEAQLLQEAQKAVNQMKQFQPTLALERGLSPAQRGAITRANQNPEIKKQLELVRQNTTDILQNTPGITKEQALANGLNSLLQSRAVNEKNKGIILFILRDEFGIVGANK